MDITAIAIVAIICGCIVSLSKHRTPSKKNKEVQQNMDIEHQRMRQELNEMAERLAVLEKIVTDEKYLLNRELNSLKD